MVDSSIRRKFGIEIEKGLRDIGLSISGTYPLLKVYPFYTLEIDFDNNIATIWYGYQHEMLWTGEIYANEVIRMFKYLHNKITNRPFDDEDFLESIYSIWKSSITEFGDKVPIRYIADKYANTVTEYNYREYTYVFFSYDLYRLKIRRIDDMEINLVVATRAYTRRIQDFLWVPYNKRLGGSYISHIKFRKIKSHL